MVALMERIPENAIGALCLIRWARLRSRNRLQWVTEENVYMSFGEYLEDAEIDTHGINDDEIFYYPAVDEWSYLRNGARHHDGWQLLTYEYQYQPNTERK
jgi:hypothetical protein